MKKNIIVLSLLAGAAFASVAHAANGTINFTGAIITDACTVNTADQSQTLALGTVASTAFSGTGSTASSVPFSIRLEACDAAITQASVRFDGQTDSADPRLLAVTGGAAGVGVAIYEANGTTLIPMHNSSSSQTITANTGTLNFMAKYMSTAATAGTITAGNANAVTQFTIDYN